MQYVLAIVDDMFTIVGSIYKLFAIVDKNINHHFQETKKKKKVYNSQPFY